MDELGSLLFVLGILVMWCATSVVLGLYLGRMIRRHDTVILSKIFQQDSVHQRCVTRMVDVVDADHTARVLREAARDWEDPVTQGHMMLLAQKKYKAGGPSMPSIWLNDRADRIEEEHR